jgi:hypothetical protein
MPCQASAITLALTLLPQLELTMKVYVSSMAISYFIAELDKVEIDCEYDTALA